MQFDRPRRREFITLLSGTVMLPLAAHAQKAPVPGIGFLHGGAQEAYGHPVAAFHKSLSELGYAEGQNVTIEFRWAEGRLERLPDLAADLGSRLN
jgi:putative ABC transport system substrate-binding protein